MKPPLLRNENLDWVNIRNVIYNIEHHKNSSRADIAKRLGLSRTTVSTIVARLLTAGFVCESLGEARGRGRPGIHLSLTKDRYYAIGAEFHSRRWVFAVTDLEGSIVVTHFEKVPDLSPESFLSGLIRGLEATARIAPKPLLPAVGIGAPGLVDCETGRIIRADDLGWKNVMVRDYVLEKLGVTVSVLNRNRASGLAEARFGAGRDVHNLVYIGIGTGISAAFISDGVLLNGTNYSAGEIGHMIVDPSGPLCGCGKHGCLHALASGSALVTMAREAVSAKDAGQTSSLEKFMQNSDDLSGELICEEAAKGDDISISCVRKAAKYLGLAAANLITTFNPDTIIIGGPVGHTGEPLLGLIRSEAEKWAMEHPFSAVSITAGKLGEFTGALGAACLVLDRKLELVLD